MLKNILAVVFIEILAIQVRFNTQKSFSNTYQTCSILESSVPFLLFYNFPKVFSLLKSSSHFKTLSLSLVFILQNFCKISTKILQNSFRTFLIYFSPLSLKCCHSLYYLITRIIFITFASQFLSFFLSVCRINYSIII